MTVISLLEDRKKNVTMPEIKTRDGAISFKNSGICRKAMKNETSIGVSDPRTFSKISSKLMKKISKEKPKVI